MYAVKMPRYKMASKWGETYSSLTEAQTAVLIPPCFFLLAIVSLISALSLVFTAEQLERI